MQASRSFPPLLAAAFLAAPAAAFAQAVDFQAAAYVAGKTFWGVDGWGVIGSEAPLPEHFIIEAGSGDKRARCNTSHNVILTRDFPSASGILNLTWRWRSADPGTHFCVGAGRSGLTAGGNPSAMACLEPNGIMGIRGLTNASTGTKPWSKDKWHYMRILLDSPRNTFTVHMASDSLRSDEGQVGSSTVMADVAAPLFRLIFRTQDGVGWVDVDDLRWEQVHHWVGGAADSNWSTAANWNPKAVPDTNAQAVFGETTTRGCALDKGQAVGSLSVSAGFKGRIALRANILSVSRNAHLAGGSWSSSAGGALALTGARGQSLSATPLSPAFPPLVHDGESTLRFDGVAVTAPAFTQNRGTLDFNGFNLTVTGDLTVRNGRPGTFRGLEGRTLTVGGNAVFEGTSKDVLLGLDPVGELPWKLKTGAESKVTADFASIAMSTVDPATGYATRSADASGNFGWIFVEDTLGTKLAPGEKLPLQGGVQITNPSDAVSVLRISPRPDETVFPPGFKDISGVFHLATEDGKAPAADFTLMPGIQGLLYRLDSAGRVFAAPNGVRLKEAGVYFVGVDTLPPSVEFLGETFTIGDSTAAAFLLQDNVEGILVDLFRSDAPGAGFTGKGFASGDTLRAALKNGSETYLPLALRLQAGDRRNTTRFPSRQGAVLLLSQRTSLVKRTPALFPESPDPEQPWELFSVPLDATPPLTLRRLREKNSGANLAARAWDPASGYRPMEEGDAFAPGAAIWLGSASGRGPTLVLPSLQAAAQAAPGERKVFLRSGWNLVANPGFVTAHWPVTRSGSADYDLSAVKSPHAYDSELGDYMRSDSLEPWRGYFVLNKGSDTTLSLLASPLPPLPKRSAGAHGAYGAAICLGIRKVTLFLGASSRGSDGLGPEDEPLPPSPARNGISFHAGRSGSRLGADIVGWKNGSSLSWRVVASIPPSRAKAAAASGTGPSLQISGLLLPEGYAAWAVFASRGTRARLLAGGSFDLYPGFTDTVDILAGPAAAMEARLAGIPAAGQAFLAQAIPAPGGLQLQFDLPFPCRVEWTVHSLSGRRMDAGSSFLPPGRHRIFRPDGSGSRQGGIRLLDLRWFPENRPAGRLAAKIPLP